MHLFAARFCQFHATMLVQSAILVVCLLLLDRVIRRRTRAVVRYGLWLLVLAKLLLPTTLKLPTGIGYWFPLQPELNLPADPEPDMPTIPFDGPRFVCQKGIQHVEPHVAAAAVPRPYPAPPPTPSRPGTVSKPPESPPTASAAPRPSEPWANAPASPQPAVSRRWRLGLFCGWYVGAVSLLGMLLQRYRQVKRLVAASTPIEEGNVHDALDRCHRDLLMRRPVGLRMTDELISPAVCGLWRPVILMPAKLLGSLSPSKLQAVFTHELCHIKRGDLWVNLLQSLLQIAYFFNPFLWLANARIRSLREKAVDEMSLGSLDGDAKAYSDALVDIAELAFSRPRFSLRLVGVVESRNALGDRIRHILSRPFPRSAKLGMLGLAAITVLAAALLPMQQSSNESGSLPRSYGSAKGSVNHQIKVGPTTFRLRSVARYSREGNPVVRAPDGTELAEPPTLPTYPRAAEWMDIATIQWDPGPEAYDLIELRVFDHQTRRDVLTTECLNFGYSLDGSTLTIYSIGRHLPDSLDIWMRVAHKQEGQQAYTLKPAKGQVVDLGRKARLKIIDIARGLSLRQEREVGSPHNQWDRAASIVELEIVRPGGKRYHICAVGKDGQRAFPGNLHYLGLVPSTQFKVFPMPMEDIDHFEVRPFIENDTFFFDGVRLPIRSAPLDRPPVIRFEVNGKPGTYQGRALPFAPTELTIREGASAVGNNFGNGKVIYGIQETGAPGTTLVLHKPGMRFMAPRAIVYDKAGKPLKARQDVISSSLLFLETWNSASKIHTVELHLDQGYLPFKPHVVGVANNLDGELRDRDGKGIGDFPYTTRRNHNLVFDFPITEQPIYFLPPDHAIPHGEKRARAVYASCDASIVDCFDGKQRVIIDTELEPLFIRERGFGLGYKRVPLDRFDYTLSYYHGPRREFHFFFRGPFSPGRRLEDGGKPYALTVYESTDVSWQHEKKVHFTLVGPASLRRDTPLVYYDHSGQRIVIPSTPHFPRERMERAGQAILDFDVFDIGLADIATFGAEIPNQISVSNIKTQFPAKSDSPRKTDRETILGFLTAKKPQSYSDEDLAKVRTLALKLAKERSAYQHVLGVQAGLRGKWPEFVDMGLAIVTGEYRGLVGYTVEDGKITHHVNVGSSRLRTKLSVAESLKGFPDLDREQLGKLKPAIQKADDPQLLGALFHLLRQTDALLTIEICKELATDERPWIWLKAMELWGGRENQAHRNHLIDRRTDPKDYPEYMQMRMVLSGNSRGIDLPAFHEAHRMIPELLTTRLLYMSGGKFRDLWRRMVEELGREEATAAAVRFLRETTDPAVHRMFFRSVCNHDYSSGLIHTVRSIAGHVNLWYGLDLHGLGDEKMKGYAHYMPRGPMPRFPNELMVFSDGVLEWRRKNPDAKPLALAIEGRVVGPEGKGIAGAEIRFHRWGRTGPYQRTGANSLTLTSKPDGSFVLPNPDRPSHYALRISADGYESKDRIWASFRSTGEYEFGKNGDVELSPK